MNTPAAFDINDPRWLAHRYVEPSDAIRFVRIEREDLAAMPFLTDEYLGNDRPSLDVPAAQVLEALPVRTPGFVFHSAFCGSTALARALDRNASAVAMSEPVLLNDVVGIRRRGAPGAAIARLTDIALRTLGRPFAASEEVVIKPSNILNSLIPLIFAMRPETKAVILHAPIEHFLISVVRKGLWCRLWVRELIEGLARDGAVEAIGLTSLELFRQSDLQVAAAGWLAQHRLFHALIASEHGASVRTLDSETLFERPRETVLAARKHLGLAQPGVDDPAFFTVHSKSMQPFTPEQRREEYARAHASYGDEIDMVVEWVTRLAEAAAVPMTLPGRLVD